MTWRLFAGGPNSRLLRAVLDWHCQRLSEQRATSHSGLLWDLLRTGDHCWDAFFWGLPLGVVHYPFFIFTTLTNLCCALTVCSRPSDYALSIGCVSYISSPVFLPSLTAGPYHSVSLSKSPCISVVLLCESSCCVIWYIDIHNLNFLDELQPLAFKSTSLYLV